MAFALILLVAGCARREPVTLERLDAQLAILPDGSLHVTERWTLPEGVDASTLIVDDPPADIHDGLSDVSTTTAGRTIERRYRAANALALSPGRARLEWPVLPPHHNRTVGVINLAVSAPPGVRVASTPGIAEPGWTVTSRPDGIEANRAGIQPSETVTAIMELGREGLTLSEPAWQFARERAREFVPAFASAAIFIVIVGLSAIVMVRAGLKSGGTAAARTAAARGLRVSGVVCLALAGALAVGVRLALHSFGPWAMSVPGAVAAVGVLFFVASLWVRRQ